MHARYAVPLAIIAGLLATGCATGGGQDYRASGRAALSNDCTYRDGVLAGRRSNPPQAACEDESAERFEAGYRLGRRLHELDDALDDVRYQGNEAGNALSGRRAGLTSYPLAQRLNGLQLRSMRVEQRIQALEAQARANGSGPLPIPQRPFYY